MRMLLEAGADPNALNAEGRSPCLAAAQLANLEGLRALLEFGADCEVATASGITPCAVATSSAHPRAAQLVEALEDRQAANGRLEDLFDHLGV